MGEDITQNNISVIGADTQILFTIKTFLLTLGSILGLFVSFYFLVFIPRVSESSAHQKELYEQQQLYISKEFNKVNEAIKTNSKTITNLSLKFDELSKTIDKSGGTLSSDVLETNEPDINNSTRNGLTDNTRYNGSNFASTSN